MPVHRKKKDTTAQTPDSRGEQTVAGLPDQRAFQQYLHELSQ